MKNSENTKKKNLICTLPRELVEEIFLRLPVRCFKCVCKSWLSLISDPQFAKSHFDLAAAPSYRLLRERYYFRLYSIDIDGSLKSPAVYSLRSPPRPSKCSVYDDAEILGSCGGFVLLYFKKRYLSLWNPSTASHQQLPDSFPNLTIFYNYGLGYIASADDYRLFLIRMQRYYKLGHRIEGYNSSPPVLYFSVKYNTWFRMEGFLLPYEHLGCRVGSPLNGALHWVVYPHGKGVPVILAFDFVKMTFSDIPLPHDLPVVYELELHHAYGLTVMGGCLSVWCYAAKEIWVMKEYKVPSSWTVSFVLPNKFYPAYTTKDGEILGSGINRRSEKRNEKGELLEHLEYGHPVGLDNLQTNIYRESLVSRPPCALEKNK